MVWTAKNEANATDGCQAPETSLTQCTQVGDGCQEPEPSLTQCTQVGDCLAIALDGEECIVCVFCSNEKSAWQQWHARSHCCQAAKYLFSHQLCHLRLCTWEGMVVVDSDRYVKGPHKHQLCVKKVFKASSGEGGGP